MNHDLLALSREIKGIAECGLHYGENEFDRERYQRLHEISSELLAAKRPDFQWPVEVGYLTPKLDTRGIVIRDGKVLLVREASIGLWTFPGGWADVNLSPSENVIREFREESGFEVEATKVLAVWDKQKQGHPLQLEYIYKIAFACKITGGEAKTSHETDAVEWFDVNALPKMCPHRGAPHYVDLALRHLNKPNLPTEFD